MPHGGDGDTSSYKEVCDAKPYGEDVSTTKKYVKQNLMVEM